MIDLRKSMTERNPMIIGVVGTVLLVAVVVFAFNFRALDIVGNDHDYGADFGDASGLNSGDPVMIAGVEVGTVGEITISGDHVHTTFTIDAAAAQKLGESSTAAIKVRTVLGQRYIELTPDGQRRMADGATIPTSRTSSGYDISRDLEEVTGQVTATGKETLSQTLDQLSDVADRLPSNVHDTIDGVRRLSDTVGSRDQALKDLLTNSASVTAILADRNQQLAEMFGQGQTLFERLNQRSGSIHRILVQTRDLADALNGLSADLRGVLRPTLDQLGRVIDLLNRNYDNVNQAITGFKTFSYQLGDAVGSGPFFQVLLHNIIPADVHGQQPLSPAAPR